MKTFLTKIRPTVPLMEVPLVRPNDLTKGGEVPFFDRRKMFPPKMLVFFHQKLPFSPKLDPPYPSWRSHLSDQMVRRKGVESHFLIEGKCFHPKCLFFSPKITFLIKIRSTVPLIEVPLVRPNGLTKRGGVPFFDRRKIFPPKMLVFFHQKF